MIVFSAINDEVGNNLKDQISCLKQNKVDFIEFRKIDGKFLFELEKSKLDEMAQLLKYNNISVSMIDTPIGKPKYNFSEDDIKLIFNQYIKIAKLFNTNNLRIFSDVSDDILLHLCKMGFKNRINLFMENEKGTKFTSFDYFIKLHNRIGMKNLFVLFDTENYFSCNGREKYLNDFNKYFSIIKYIHLRDYDNNYTIITTGNLEIGNIINQMSKNIDDVYISIESHLPMISSVDKRILFSKNMEEIYNKVNRM